MRVIISAGGTGGHIYPALAIINKIKEKEPNSEFLYIGTHNRMEKDIVPKEGIPFKNIEIYGFNRKQLWKNFKTIKCMIKSYFTCKKIIKEFNPDIVIGVGGYVTVPVLYTAHKLGYKTVIHEQNSIPGASNKFIANFADKVLVSLKNSMDAFDKNKAVYTGNPCSENATNIKPALKSEFGLKTNKKLVLMVFGSLGASVVSDYIKKHFNDFESKDYEVLFSTGENIYDEVNKVKHPSNVHIVPYIENMPRIMKKTDLLVTRAGASTISEIIALGIPSIFIPSPYVPNNHQFKNAFDLVNEDAGIIIEEKDLKDNVLVDTIDKVFSDKKLYNNIKKNLSKLKIDDSATLIYNEIKKLVSDNNGINKGIK